MAAIRLFEHENDVHLYCHWILKTWHNQNKTNPKFGIDYIYSNQNQKSLLTNGFDVSENRQHQLKIRWNISTKILLLNSVELLNTGYTSEYFTQKNYSINTIKNSSTLQWQPISKFRASVNYKFKNKINKIGNEKAILQEIGPEIKINSPKQGMVSAKMSIILNRYNGEENSPITYTMLEGFQPGKNYQFAVNFSRNINKFLRLNLTYSARKPAETDVIHTGQFSLSAYF